MAHPFERMFEKALKKSTLEENLVLEEAEKLLKKGYSEKEICTVLLKLEKGYISDTDAGIIREAREEVCESLESENEDED